MSDILFIKTSSLGDVIHHMPAAADVRRYFPAARIAWVVEEAYAPLLRLHPAINEVIPVAARRWWGVSLLTFSTWREAFAFKRLVRARPSGVVIDTQGLLKSALMAYSAKGTRHGYDQKSIKEPAASIFYNVRHEVSRDLHAIERNRRLTALALGYSFGGNLDYGLDRAKLKASPAKPYAVFVHATAQAKKRWPEERWIETGRALHSRGLEIVLPWGSAGERAAAERIAASVPGARVPDKAPLDAMARLIAGAALVVGVDTGLLHLAAALGVPLVGIFVASEPGLTGPMGRGPIEIVGAMDEPPFVAQVTTAIENVTRA
ncbi:MAG TPA: lipopolysaccharide heptosyltransferase I [Xanthobacteraceae bacterium]|jgi:heptosyltransferase-1